jgi:RHS repeat-associated protein
MNRATLLLGLLLSDVAGALTGITYYHNNVLGSPVAATDESGALKWRASYWPHGASIQTGGDLAASVFNPVWFTGHVRDPESGLIYMRARYYNPALGRFMSIDPVAFSSENPGSFNRYAYANNNPLLYVDPDGRESVVFSIKGTVSPGFGISAGTGVYASFPFMDDTPWDLGLLNTGAIVSGMDISATANLSIMDGGRENIEGLQIGVSSTLPLTGVAGPAVDAEHIINPKTGKSSGGSLGVGLSMTPGASVSYGASFVSFSLRDVLMTLGGSQVSEDNQAQVEVDPAALDFWYWAIAN